jgi:hypothetical protein
MGIIQTVLAFLRALLVGRAALAAENPALRHELPVRALASRAFPLRLSPAEDDQASELNHPRLALQCPPMTRQSFARMGQMRFLGGTGGVRSGLLGFSAPGR